MTTRIRTWVANHVPPNAEPRRLGIFEARVGYASQRASELWPTYYTSGHVVIVRDPDEQAMEKREAAARG